MESGAIRPRRAKHSIVISIPVHYCFDCYRNAFVAGLPEAKAMIRIACVKSNQGVFVSAVNEESAAMTTHHLSCCNSCADFLAFYVLSPLPSALLPLYPFRAGLHRNQN